MSNQYFGYIEIPFWLIDEEVAAQIKEDFGFEANGDGVNIHGETDFNLQNGVASYNDNMAIDGQFEELETLLCSKRIPFNRYSSRDCEYDAVRVYYRPERGPGNEMITVLLPGYEEEPQIPAALVEALKTVPLASLLEEIDKLLTLYDPKVTALEVYAKSVETPLRLPEEQEPMNLNLARQLLEKSGFVNVQFICEDAGFYYLKATLIGSSTMYDFRLDRFDVLHKHQYELCSKIMGSLDWFHSETFTVNPRQIEFNDVEGTLYSIGIIAGDSREQFAVIGDDLTHASTLALKQYHDLFGEDTVPVIDPETSYEITCAADKNGRLFYVLLKD